MLTKVFTLLGCALLVSTAQAKYIEEPKLIVHPVTSWADGFATPSGAYDYFTCAVDQEALKCWGWVPWEVPAWPHGTQIDAGRSHLCGLIENRVECVSSSNRYGEANPPAFTDAAKLFAGEFHNCVITKTKGVVCWGKNNFGQATVPSNLQGIISVSASRNHTCALSETGSINCWGDNSEGQLDVPANLGEVNSLKPLYDKNERVGEHYWSDGTCANDLFAGRIDRRVCWGKNYYGPRVWLQKSKIAELDNVQRSDDYACGTRDGLLICEGMIPMANPPVIRNVKTISLSRHSGCATTQDGTSVCWGNKRP